MILVRSYLTGGFSEKPAFKISASLARLKEATVVVAIENYLARHQHSLAQICGKQSQHYFPRRSHHRWHSWNSEESPCQILTVS
jgi:hypothetical protein